MKKIVGLIGKGFNKLNVDFKLLQELHGFGIFEGKKFMRNILWIGVLIICSRTIAQSNFVDLNKVNSFKTLSSHKKKIDPYKINNGEIHKPRLTFLTISNNGQIALAVNQFSDLRSSFLDVKKAYLINLLDGYIFYEFDYESIKNHFFNFDDTKLFYYDNKFIKQIDLFSLEITNLFEIETQGYDKNNVILDSNKIQVLQDQYENPINKLINYTYNLISSKKEINTFYEFDYLIKNDIQKEFNTISGTTQKKLQLLKLIHGDEIQIKPLAINTREEFLILNYPNIFIVKNDHFILVRTLQLCKTDQVTKEVKPYFYFKSQDDYKKIQLTINNEIVFTAGKSLFVFKLDIEKLKSSDANQNFKIIDPFEIQITTNDRYLFAHLDSKSGKLFYQVDIDFGCDYDNDYELNVLDYKNNLLKNEKNGMKDIMIKYLMKIDKTLFSYYNSNINTDIIKNQPLEDVEEKYFRVREINSKINPIFMNMKDSLIKNLNEIIIDSIKVFQYDASKIFNVQNYVQSIESWRLVFKNPYNGKDFSIIYPQSKSDAKLNLSSKFLNVMIEVKFYFNLLSLAYEPLLVSITNTESKNSNKYIISFRDASLLKNIYLTDNSYVDEDDYLHCRLMRGEITFDENIFKYFVAIGMPKYYFNFGFYYPNPSKKTGVSVLNIEDLNINYVFQDIFIPCCPSSIDYGEYNQRQFLRFNSIPYFVNTSNHYPKNDKEKTNVYEINNIVLLEQENGVLYPNGESPNGKYTANTTGIYKKSNGIPLIEFENASGKVYWDCNSYYVGIGSDIFPVPLLESIMK